MSAQSAIIAGRRAAEALMMDTFTAYSPDGTTTGADDMESPAWKTEWTTKGKVRGNSLISHDTAERAVIVGLVQRPILEGALHIPVSAPLPEIGWEFVCTAAGIGSDSAMVGTRWHVVNVPVLSFMTARRLDVVRL